MGQAQPHSAQAGVSAALEEKAKEPLKRRSDPRYFWRVGLEAHKITPAGLAPQVSLLNANAQW